jgi:predicted SAM-dependent methyltransferase
MSLSYEPPSSFFGKFSYYRQKYGTVHTVSSYMGRYNPFLWKIIATAVTRKYIHRWQKENSHRILNLGGGSNCLIGCLTVDISPRADAYVDIYKKLPFADDSIEAIFCEEVIEHVELNVGDQLLQECWRILKPGGFIRLSTPDLEWFAQRVVSNEHPIACEEINEIFYNHGHRYLYDRKSLKSSCQKVGFVNLYQSVYQDPKSQLGHFDSHAERFNHPPEMSQYLEAQKPTV